MVVLTLASLLAIQAGSPGANFYPFVMPWDDRLAGTATDVSGLNAKPAGRNGRIVARNGHFIENTSGRRIRLFGTNVGGSAAFPSRADADKIAARMAKLGINIVRFHHLNNGWDLDGGTIWQRGRTHIEMDPAQLDKLDYFVAALKKQGIYSNINLQTSREYLPELGLPETARQLKNFGKKVDKFYARMIELQEEYAKDLLDRVNPYTRLKYNADPAVMVVEINNENSLVGWPGESPGAGLDSLPEPFRGELVRQWNDWLRRRYTDTARLRTAWPSVSTLTGPELITAANRWTSENQGNGVVEFQPRDGQNTVITVTSNGGPDWHIQAHLGGLTLVNGKNYTLRFRARADRETSVGVDSRLDKPDWRFLGLGATAALTPSWREFAMTFTARNTEPGHARIGFVLGASRGRIELADIRLQEGTFSEGLQENESLGSIGLPTPSASARFREYTQFLVDTERAYSLRMRRYLRDQLGFRNTNIIDTQVAWGGLTSLVRESEMEFVDNHAYWNHPTFLGADWDPKNYRVDRRALVNSLPGNSTTLWDLATFRVAGKPYSVSEYNHPAPNDFQSEMMPVYAAFGSLQNWDILYTFAWDATGTGRDNTRYVNYFDMALNPAKAAFFPSAALMFRSQQFLPAAKRAVLGVDRRTPWSTGFTGQDAWVASGWRGSMLDTQMAIAPGRPAGVRATTGTVAGGTITVTGPQNRRVLTGNSPAAKVISGFLRNGVANVSGLRAKFGGFENDFAALTLVSTNGQPVDRAPRALLTLIARVENRNMGWNADRTSVSDQWGEGPTMAEFVPAEFSIRTTGPRQVFPLDGQGRRLKPLAATWQNGWLTFRTRRDNPSVWIEIAAR